MPSAYSVALELAAVLAVWLGLGAWQNDRGWPGRGCFVGLAGAVALACLGTLFAEREFVRHFTGEQIRYAGSLAIPALWLGLAAQGARLEIARRMPWFPLLLLLPSACIYGLFHMGPWSGLFVFDQGDTSGLGPLWPIHQAYAHTLITGGSLIFVVRALRWTEPGRVQRRFGVAAAGFLPLLGLGLALGTDLGVELTPLLFTVALAALRGALFRGGLFDVVPVDQRDLFRHLRIGIVLADASGTVIDVNPAGEAHLGIPRAQALGRTLDAVLALVPAEVPVEIQPILSGGRPKATCAVMTQAPHRRRETPLAA